VITRSKYIPKTRQTLLFSATALRAEIATKKSAKDKKWLDKVKIKGIGSIYK
jgi:superfamily II DNA/RNA helicase